MINTYMVVLTTFSKPETGEKIIDALLSRKLAACIQSVAIKSCYSWKGSIAKDDETLLLIKTKATHFPEIEKTIRSVHDYETPEIIGVPVVNAFKGYTDWIEEVAG
jgi:periplasmic divalent cation tolerance protein